MTGQERARLARPCVRWYNAIVASGQCPHTPGLLTAMVDEADNVESGPGQAPRPARLPKAAEVAAVVLVCVAALGLVLVWLGERPRRPAALRAAKPGPVDTPQAELRLSVLTADPRDLTLLLELWNTGKVPFKVDRELVFLVSVGASGARGEPLGWEHFAAAPYPGKEALTARPMVVEPGESVQRMVDLTHGFKQVVAMTGMYAAGQKNAGSDFAQGHEDLYRLPPLGWPSSVWAVYEPPGYVTAAGLNVYTGGSFSSMDLYEGLLWAEVAIPARKVEPANSGSP